METQNNNQIEKNLDIIKEVQNLERLNETPLFTWDDLQKAKRQARWHLRWQAVGIGLIVGYLVFMIFLVMFHQH